MITPTTDCTRMRQRATEVCIGGSRELRNIGECRHFGAFDSEQLPTIWAGPKTGNVASSRKRTGEALQLFAEGSRLRKIAVYPAHERFGAARGTAGAAEAPPAIHGAFAVGRNRDDRY